MRIPRIFVDLELTVDSVVNLPKEPANHLANVLRLKVGHPVVLFNGDGNEYSAELQDITRKQASALVLARLGINVESPLSLHLMQGVSKGERMDLVMQKSAELGVTEITPVITERCPVKLNQERWEKKLQHWEKVLISACEQCGRNKLPTLNAPVNFMEAINQSTNQLRLILHPQAEQRIANFTPPGDGVRLLIGPEGGLSDPELYQAVEFGYHKILMGPRVLRTETAAIAAISLLQAQFGDI